ncbi:membrane protein [Streptomyces sp. NRRL B-1568]|nr:membrane protein [Streptomyces sp. NRRL B-1568]
MELLFILLAVVVICGVVVAPAMRRRRALQDTVHGAGSACDPAGAHGFVPPERLDLRLPGPDPDLLAAVTEARRTQDWKPAAELLARTDAASAPELRWQRVQTLAGAAVRELAEAPGTGGMWLRHWRVVAPEDAGGAAVQAEFLVQQALRDPSSQDYRMILEEARTVCAEAAALAPEDVVPSIVELGVARGLGASEAEFQSLWETVAARAPQHMGAHLVALRYWSANWHGSQDQAEAFAQRVAAAAPKGSLLPALPLFAVYDHLPDVQLVRGLFQSVVVREAIEAAQYAVAHAPADHPVLPHVRHLLLWFLVRAERYGEALEQVRAVDGHIGAVPWTYEQDPVAAYTAYRAMAVSGWESGRN